MAGNITNYLEDVIINATLRNVGTGLPVAQPYVALHTGDPGDAGTANEIENAHGYARTAVTMGAPSGGVSTNSAAVTFPQASADWDAVTYFSIWDSGTYGGGNCLYWGQLSSSKTVLSGDYGQFAIGAISVTIT